MSLPVLLFTHDAAYAAAACRAGVAGIVVDWEWRGKAERQCGRDTEINLGTADDLRAIRATCEARVVCRVNNTPGAREREIDLALALGADEIWLPMVRRVDEVEETLAQIGGAAGLGVVVETREAIGFARKLGALPITRAFIGLHDLRIDRGHTGLFDPLLDGTVDRFREGFPGVLGVAGVTDPRFGEPVPQSLLLAQMARLRCGFAVARRSFRRDIPIEAIGEALDRISTAYASLLRRDSGQVEADRVLLADAVRSEGGTSRPRALA